MRLIIATSVAGRRAVAGPLTVCATAWLSDVVEPAFTYPDSTGAMVKRRLFAVVQDVPPNILVRVLDYVRATVVALYVVNLPACRVRALGLDGATTQATALAVQRLQERLRYMGYRFPEDTVTVLHSQSTDWRAGATNYLVRARRKEEMGRLHLRYPVYAFHKNFGVLTDEHRKAIRRYKTCPAHRGIR